MPIQKINSCTMGGPEKGQWVTIILIRAFTSVCSNHNHFPNEILPRSSDIGKAFVINHHLHQTPRRRIPIFLTQVTKKTSLLLYWNAVGGIIAFHHVDAAEIPHQTKVQLNNLQTKQENLNRISEELEYSILTLLFQQLRGSFAFYLRLSICLLVKML